MIDPVDYPHVKAITIENEITYFIDEDTAEICNTPRLFSGVKRQCTRIIVHEISNGYIDFTITIDDKDYRIIHGGKYQVEF